MNIYNKQNKIIQVINWSLRPSLEYNSHQIIVEGYPWNSGHSQALAVHSHEKMFPACTNQQWN